ncbi:MAG: ParB/RepB/Spo0J family partition protein [Planctomycetota bacterium]
MSQKTALIGQDVDVKKVRLDQIDKGPAHIRTCINEEALDELKDSIEKLGLLQPIVVIRKKKAKPDGREYDLVIGSRRLAAHEKLGRKRIPAIILGENNKEQILAASLAENMFRARLSHKDTAKAVTKLYKLYGNDEKKVAKQTGMWPETVLRYVYLKEYGTEKMLRWVNEGSATLLDVKRMLHAAQWNITKAEKLLEQMIKEEMTPAQKKNYAEYMSNNPSAKPGEGVEDARKPRVKNKLLIDLPAELREGITKAMKEWHMEADEIATQALSDWLEEQGYIE